MPRIPSVLGLSALTLLLAPTAAAAETADETVLITEELIVDDAEILDQELLVEEINEQFEPTGEHPEAQVAIFTSDNADENDYDQTITDELISQGPEEVIVESRLNENLVVITISPEIRQLGVYSGNQLPDATPLADEVIEVMRPLARDADWNNTAFNGTASYLELAGIIETQNDEPTTASDQQRSESAEAFVSMLGWIAGAVVILGILLGAVVALIYGIRTLIRNRRAAQGTAEIRSTHSETQIQRALNDWSLIQKAWDNRKKVFSSHPNTSLATHAQKIVNSLTTLKEGGRLSLDELDSEWFSKAFITSAYREELETAEMLEGIRSHNRIWKTMSTRLHATLTDEIHKVTDEIETINLTGKPAKNIRRKADSVLAAAEKSLRKAEKDPTRRGESLSYLLALENDFDNYVTSVIRGLDKEQRSTLVKPESSHRYDDTHSSLWPLLITAYVVTGAGNGSSSTSSAYSSSTSSSYSSMPTTTFTGGGFSGGSGGF